MRLLDLFCKAGGCAVGYHRAGFTEIVGVDIEPQPRYPFTFIQGDALAYLAENGPTFDVIHASPPCQAYSFSSARWRNSGKVYPDLLGPTSAALRALGKPYIIENVIGSRPHMDCPILLCGSMFGLGVVRHRLFDCSNFIMTPPHIRCSLKDADIVSGYGHGPPGRWYRKATVARHGGNGPHYSLDIWKEAMGIDWMTRDELTQAIPPAYTEFIGRQILEQI